MLAVTYTDVGLYLEYAYLRFLVNLNNAEYAPTLEIRINVQEGIDVQRRN